jgi:hypothetical protein
MKKPNAIELFAHFTACWGNTWTSRFTDKTIHALALMHWQQMLDSLLPEQIATGLSVAIDKLDFPPSIAQFKKLALGLLSPNEAYQAALNGYRTYRRLINADDSYWKCYPDKARNEFYAAYDAYVSEVLQNNAESEPELEGESSYIPRLC